MLRRYVLTLLLIAFTLPAFAAGEQPLTLTDALEKEITVIENGISVTKRVPADTTEPGAELIYTLRYANTAAAPATNLTFKNQVPELAVYIDGSARGDRATVTFSVDGGKTYAPLAELKVPTADGKRRAATAADVTHVRWQLAEIPAGSRGDIGCRYRVK